MNEAKLLHRENECISNYQSFKTGGKAFIKGQKRGDEIIQMDDQWECKAAQPFWKHCGNFLIQVYISLPDTKTNPFPREMKTGPYTEFGLKEAVEESN